MKKTLLSLLAMLLLGVSGAWADGATVGNTDNTSTWWTAFSDYYKVPEGQRAHVTFTNYTDGTANANNWILVTNVADTQRDGEGYAEYFVLRADNYGWGTNYDETTLKSAYNWDTFKTDMNGSSVDMYVYNNSGKIYVSANITTTAGTVYPYSFNSTATGANDFTFFMTTELGHLENLNVTIEDIPVDNNWKIDFSALGITADAVATVSDAVSSNLGTVTINTTALDTRFGVQAGTSWKFYAKGYFQNINSGGRALGVFSAKAGQLIVLNATAEATPTTNATLKLSYGNQHVYEVTADGDVVLNMPKNSPIYSIQVSDNLYTYSIKAKSGETELGTIAAGVADKGTSATTFWSKYVNVENKWYSCAETTATFTEATEKIVECTESTITQFIETNDMTVSKTYGTKDNDAAYSNGNGVGIYGGGSGNVQATMITKTTIPAGTYEVGIYAVVRNAGKTDGFNIYTSTDNENWTSAGTITINAGTGLSTANVTISADSYIKFENSVASNQQHYVDYVTFAPVYNYSVKINVGGTTTDITNGAAGAGKEIYWSKYQKVGDKWYSVPSTYMTVSATESNDIVLEANAEDIVDFIEAENMTLSRTYGNYSGNNASAGAAMGVASGANLATTTTVAAGTYYFGYYGTVRRSGQDDFTFQTSANGTDWTDAGTITMTDNVAGLYFTDAAVTLSSDSYVRIVEKNSKNTLHYVDYMVIQTEKPVPTAISNVNAAANKAAATTAKFMKAGKLVIMKNGAEYNAAGQQMK